MARLNLSKIGSTMNPREHVRDHGGTEQSIPVSEMRANVESQQSLVEDDKVSIDDIDGVFTSGRASVVSEEDVPVDESPLPMRSEEDSSLWIH